MEKENFSPPLLLQDPKKLHLLGSVIVNSGKDPQRRMTFYGGSLLDFSASFPASPMNKVPQALSSSPIVAAIVNAANTGGVTGFGIDEMVNRACGDVEMKAARKLFNGIATGNAKVTPAFAHSSKVSFVFHAVGPVYRDNSLMKSNRIVTTTTSMKDGDDDSSDVQEKKSEPLPMSTAEKDELLRQAYLNALIRGCQYGCHVVAFSLLSAGVFRGQRPLNDVIAIGVTAVVEFLQTYELDWKGKISSCPVDQPFTLRDGDSTSNSSYPSLPATSTVIGASKPLTPPTKGYECPREVVFCAYTPEEQTVLSSVLASLPLP